MNIETTIMGHHTTVFALIIVLFTLYTLEHQVKYFAHSSAIITIYKSLNNKKSSVFFFLDYIRHQ